MDRPLCQHSQMFVTPQQCSAIDVNIPTYKPTQEGISPRLARWKCVTISNDYIVLKWPAHLHAWVLNLVIWAVTCFWQTFVKMATYTLTRCELTTCWSMTVNLSHHHHSVGDKNCNIAQLETSNQYYTKDWHQSMSQINPSHSVLRKSQHISRITNPTRDETC